jgi:3-deoxy-D-manno-octulosonate 8-phosphate phosphatase (KDO 8-P phosphatase)
LSKQRAKKIKLLLLDVDGVMTDGTIFLFPAPSGAAQTTQAHAAAKAETDSGYAIVSQSIVEAKGFHAHDGTAMSLARLGGLKTGVITKRISETVALRARDLKVDYVYQGAADKESVFYVILGKSGLRADETAYLGDDVIDLPVMRLCGLAAAVANAREEVKDEAHFITDHRGGDGAVRDFVEYILKAQGTWERCVDDYIAARTPANSSRKAATKK